MLRALSVMHIHTSRDVEPSSERSELMKLSEARHTNAGERAFAFIRVWVFNSFGSLSWTFTLIFREEKYKKKKKTEKRLKAKQAKTRFKRKQFKREKKKIIKTKFVFCVTLVVFLFAWYWNCKSLESEREKRRWKSAKEFYFCVTSFRESTSERGCESFFGSQKFLSWIPTHNSETFLSREARNQISCRPTPQTTPNRVNRIFRRLRVNTEKNIREEKATTEHSSSCLFLDVISIWRIEWINCARFVNWNSISDRFDCSPCESLHSGEGIRKCYYFSYSKRKQFSLQTANLIFLVSHLSSD